MPTYYGENVTEAIAKGLQTLQITKEEAQIEVIEEGKKGFFGIGRKSAVVQVTRLLEKTAADSIKQHDMLPDTPPTNEEHQSVPVEAVSSKSAESLLMKGIIDSSETGITEDEVLTELALYLTRITQELNAPALVRIEHQDHQIIYHLDADKKGVLIGKHGKVINALQYLAQTFINRQIKKKLTIVVNVGDYRQHRDEILRRLTKKTAAEVRRTGQSVHLDPMPAFERKQVHSLLTKESDIVSHSEGNEPYRYLIIERKAD